MFSYVFLTACLGFVIIIYLIFVLYYKYNINEYG